MNTNPRERKLLPFLAGCLVLAVAGGVTIFFMLARRETSPLGEPFPLHVPPAFRLTGLRTAKVEMVSSPITTAGLAYDLPPSHSGLSLTNMVLQTWQLQWRPARPASSPSLWNEGIESAERINELLLRRAQDEWRRAHGM